MGNSFKPFKNQKTFNYDNLKEKSGNSSSDNTKIITQPEQPENFTSIETSKAPAAFSAGAFFYGNNSMQSGGKWAYGLSASGSGVLINHYTTRANARSAYHETPQAKALVDRYADTVADIGLLLEPTPKYKQLGISMDQAQEWAQNVEEMFDSWAKSKLSHRAENMNWYQSHRLYQIEQHRDNDQFIRLYYSNSKNLLNPLQFEFIDADQIRGDSFTSSWGYKSLQDGIVRDTRGREKSYKIWVQIPNKIDYKQLEIPRIGEKSKRIFMLHGFVPEYAGQRRGYSRLSHAIQEFENITDFTSATIKKAINAASLNFYTKPGPDQPASNPLEDLLEDRGAGPAANQFGSSNGVPSCDDQDVPNISGPPVDYYRVPEATLDSPGVNVWNLKQGEDLKLVQNSVEASSFDTFIESFTSFLSSSMSIPIEVLLMKFGKSYSASRGALILFWRVAQIWREEMASDYLNPVYQMWLSEEIAAGRIVAPGWQDPRLKMAWLSCRWIGSPMPNIDPMKTAKSDEKYVELGAQTLDNVARNYNGSNGASNRARLIKEYNELPTAKWNLKQ